MAAQQNDYLTTVSERLYHCDLLLAEYQQVAPFAEQGLKQQATAKALLHGAFYHLVATYPLYLKEIAQSYRCRTPGQVNSVGDLTAALADVNRPPAEATELALLEEQRGSFLHAMLMARHQLDRQFSATDFERPLHSSASGDIPAVQVSDISLDIEISADNIQTWKNEFRALIARHREHMVEY